jgi:hypothetical protein
MYLDWAAIADKPGNSQPKFGRQASMQFGAIGETVFGVNMAGGSPVMIGTPGLGMAYPGV